MTRQIEAVKKLYADFARGDVEAVLAACSEDSCWTIPGSTYVASDDTHVGKGAIGEFVADLVARMDIDSFAPESIIQDGDLVVTVGYLRGTARCSGRSFSAPWLHCWRIANGPGIGAAGKITRFDDSFDTLAAAQALV